MRRVAVGVRTVDQLDIEPAGSLEEERAGVVAVLLSRDVRPARVEPRADPLGALEAERDMVHPGELVAAFGVAEPEYLVAEEKEGVIRALAQDVGAERFDEEGGELRSIPDIEIDVVEAGDPRPFPPGATEVGTLARGMLSHAGRTGRIRHK